jgi:hypothetical protein
MINKNWIYVLKAEGFDTIKLQDNPEGWDQQLTSIKRSPSYFGLFREISTSLRFVGDGAAYLQQVYEQVGTEFEVQIEIYEYSPPPDDIFKISFTGIVDLSVYDVSELFVEVDINETSFARKLMSRDDITVNFSETTSIEGIDLGDNQQVSVRLHQRQLLKTGNLEINTEANELVSNRGSFDEEGIAFPLVVTGSDLPNLTTVTITEFDSLGSTFWNALGGEINQDITFKGNIKASFLDGTDTVSSTWKLVFRFYEDNTLASYVDSPALWQYIGQLDGKPPVNVTFDETYTVTPNNVVALCLKSDLGAVFGGFIIRIDQADITIEFNESAEDSVSTGYFLHEAMKRITEVITDKKDGFYSDFLGRTDIGYSTTGIAALEVIMSGKQIRRFPDAVPSMSFKDLFDSLNAIHNIGIGIEYNNVGQPYLRLENKNYFFDGTVVAALYSVSELHKKVAREWIYNSVKVGYDKSEYEEVNGIEEYNNKFTWAISGIKTIKNEYNIVSELRADGYGIEFARRKSYLEFPTEDTKYDNDNFIIKIRQLSSQYYAAKKEEYDVVENIFSPETAYNLDLSPGRMLRNHGGVIRPGIEKYLHESNVKFQYAEQKQNMASQRTGNISIDENANIDPNDLDQGIWIPEIYSFKSELSTTLLDKLIKKPTGIIKFSTSTEEKTTQFYYGWILDVKNNEDTDEAEWQLLRVNLKSENLNLIDPTGNTPDPIPPEIDPGIPAGFEYPFEFIFVE